MTLQRLFSMMKAVSPRRLLIRLPLWASALFWLLAGLRAQTPANFSKPSIAGMAIASRYGVWRLTGIAKPGTTGQNVITLDQSTATLPDGTSFLPLSVNTPLMISDAPGSSVTVTPQEVNCSSGSGICTITAIFPRTLGNRVTLSSATGGVQEALNAQATRGGIVLADAGLKQPLASYLPQLHLTSGVLLVEIDRGSWQFYAAGATGAPQLLAGFNSAGTSSLNRLASLNGVQFVSTHNFLPQQPGTSLAPNSEVTITPPWQSLPPGLIAGDSIYLSGGAGTAETVVVTNTGTNCPNGSANSICFTPSQSHSGNWTLQSATAGVQEAINDAGPGGWVWDDTASAELYAPVVINSTVRITGFSNSDSGIGTTLIQNTPGEDVVQIGSSGAAPSDVVLEDLMAEGVKGDGSDAGVAFHCLNCIKLKLINVTGKQAHDGVYFDSSYGHAFDASVTGSHFIGNYYGVHIVGGSANRLTFEGNTIDGNVYGVWDDGGWVHTWVGNDIEANTRSGYWQQVSQPALYSAHNLLLHGNYFETNGANTAGQGDLNLGALVNGGSGNNGAGCIGCDIDDNVFNASPGGNTIAIQLGAFDGTLSNNTYSGYGAGKLVTTISGPNPNYTHALSLGDASSRAGTIQRLDANGTLTLGGTDQLLDQFGSPLLDTTLESPTGLVSVRGVSGGLKTSNPAILALDGDSSGQRGSSLLWRNQHVNEFGINNDPYGSNSHDWCALMDYANPAQGVCLAYENGGHWKFNATGEPGTVTLPGDYQFSQQANGDQTLVINRNTDTNPSGYLLDLEDATLSTPLFRVDATGAVVAGRWNAGPLSSPSVTTASLQQSAATGLNSTGANLTLAAGQGTGNAAGGVVQFEISPSGTSGSGTNPLVLAGSIQPDGTLAWNYPVSSQGNTLLTAASMPLAGQTGSILGQAFAAGTCATSAITISGVAAGMTAAASPETDPGPGFTWEAFVSSANTVLVRLCNISGAAATSAASIYDVRVIR